MVSINQHLLNSYFPLKHASKVCNYLNNNTQMSRFELQISFNCDSYNRDHYSIKRSLKKLAMICLRSLMFSILLNCFYLAKIIIWHAHSTGSCLYMQLLVSLLCHIKNLFKISSFFMSSNIKILYSLISIFLIR